MSTKTKSKKSTKPASSLKLVGPAKPNDVPQRLKPLAKQHAMVARFAAAVNGGKPSFAATSATNAGRLGVGRSDRKQSDGSPSVKNQIFHETLALIKRGKLDEARSIERMLKTAKRVAVDYAGDDYSPATMRSWLGSWTGSNRFFPAPADASIIGDKQKLVAYFAECWAAFDKLAKK